MDLSLIFVVFCIATTTGVSSGQKCYHCAAVTQGAEEATQAGFSITNLISLLSPPNELLGDCNADDPVKSITCPVNYGCNTENFTFNVSVARSKSFPFSGIRRTCHYDEVKGCRKGSDYANLVDINQLNFGLATINNNFTIVGLVDGQVCVCDGDLCNDGSSKATNWKINYVILLSLLLVAFMAK